MIRGIGAVEKEITISIAGKQKKLLARSDTGIKSSRMDRISASRNGKKAFQTPGKYSKRAGRNQGVYMTANSSVWLEYRISIRNQ